MKNLKTLLIVSSLVWAWNLNCQISWNEFSSPEKDFSFEYPSSFNIQVAIGANVKFKAGDLKGNSIVVVKKFAGFEMQIEDLMSISQDVWESSLPLLNAKLIKKGEIYTDYQNGFYTIISSTDIDSRYTLVHSSYQFLKEGSLYNIMTTCNKNDYEQMNSIFYRVKQSFNLNTQFYKAHEAYSYDYVEWGPFQKGKGYIKEDSRNANFEFKFYKNEIIIYLANQLHLVLDIIQSGYHHDVFQYHTKIRRGGYLSKNFKEKTINGIVSVIPEKEDKSTAVIAFRETIGQVPHKLNIYKRTK